MTILALLAAVSPALADRSALSRCTPADALVAVYVERTSEAPPDEGPSILNMIALVLERGREMGLLADVDIRTRLILDGLASVPLLTRQSFSVQVMDFSLVPRRDGGSELGSLSMAVVAHTAGRHEELARRIQQIINRHTHKGSTTLEPIQRKNTVSYRLIDARLPSWAVLEWGVVGDEYVLTLGVGAFEKVCAAMYGPRVALYDDPWYRSACVQSGSQPQSLQIMADLNGIRDRAAATGSVRTAAILKALNLEGASKALWVVARNDRAVEITTVQARGEGDVVVPWTVRRANESVMKGVIPAQASSYLVLDKGGRQLLLGIRDLYLATCRPEARTKLTEAWRREEQAAGISFEREVLQQLGGTTILHTYPEHPLDLPVVCTVLMKIDGSAEAVRRCLDVTLRRVSELLPCDVPVLTGGQSWLRRAEDGVWYVQFGLIGPAVAVTDDWIVLSYSPSAVRANLELLAKTTSQPSPSPVSDRPTTTSPAP